MKKMKDVFLPFLSNFIFKEMILFFLSFVEYSHSLKINNLYVKTSNSILCILI